MQLNMYNKSINEDKNFTSVTKVEFVLEMEDQEVICVVY